MIMEQKPNFIVSLSTVSLLVFMSLVAVIAVYNNLQRNYLPNLHESISSQNIVVTNHKKVVVDDLVLYFLDFTDSEVNFFF
jgi:hypothetical protein